MPEKEKQKKDHHRNDSHRDAMREGDQPRKEQASIRFGEQKRGEADGRRRNNRRS